MIYGIGHDIVDNQRINKLIVRYQQRFLQHILTPLEINIYTSGTSSSNFVAKRFAAKEAFAKACGTGLRSPILLTNISILNDSLGRPYLVLAEELVAWLNSSGISQWHLTLSDEKQFSSAVVVLEKLNLRGNDV